MHRSIIILTKSAGSKKYQGGGGLPQRNCQGQIKKGRILCHIRIINALEGDGCSKEFNVTFAQASA